MTVPGKVLMFVGIKPVLKVFLFHLRGEQDGTGVHIGDREDANLLAPCKPHPVLTASRSGRERGAKC